MNINIGQLLTQHFEKHRTRRAALARHMGIFTSGILRYQKCESLQTKTLITLCTHLKHNFFMDIALMLPPEYTTTTNPVEAKNQRNAYLEHKHKSHEHQHRATTHPTFRKTPHTPCCTGTPHGCFYIGNTTLSKM